MRKTKTCPKCAGTKLLAIDVVADTQGGGSATVQAYLAVRHEGVSFMGNKKTRDVGALQAVVCSACGYVEHYVADPEALQPDGHNIREL